MKFGYMLLFSLLFFSIFAPAPKAKAQDVDYVAAAIEALQTSNVYVYPGTPETDLDTQSKLGTFLSTNDNIVLIILPHEALINTDLYTIAQKISTGLNNQKTIGLAVESEVIGYSPILPEGVASDKMNRANSVSNDPVTALITFTQNIHNWLSKYPQPSPTPSPEPTRTPRPTREPIDLPKAKDMGWPVWTCLGIIIVLLFTFLARIVPDRIKKAKEETKRQERYDNLEQLRTQIQFVEIDVENVSDKKIRKDLQGAIPTAYGLIDMLQSHKTYIGITESLTPDMINNMGRQVKALLRHESGRRPMTDDLLQELTEALMNYDALFKSLQADDPDTAELLASIIQTKTTVISRKGYLE